MTAVLAVALFLDLQPKCVSSQDVTACGYQCVTAMKTAACAKAPQGVCASTGFQVACYDPSPDVRWLLANDPDVERPSCISSTHAVACGFHCMRQGSAVKCAQTPEGACHANQTGFVCWDPPEPVRWRMLQQGNISYAGCISFLDHIECGYHCTAVGTTLKCAVSPQGMCETHFTQVSCFDPPYDDVLPVPTSNQ
jgi:hypothetical protein